VTIQNSTVSDNIAGQAAGGLLNLADGSLVIEGSTIYDNSAGWGGGGLENWGSLTITNSAIVGNSALREGGALFLGDHANTMSTVNGNCIAGNTDPAVFNSGSSVQDFTSNWWGDSSGPGGVWTGLGDSVGPNINFDGWLTEPPGFCPGE
jgi:hypothetical protein